MFSSSLHRFMLSITSVSTGWTLSSDPEKLCLAQLMVQDNAMYYNSFVDIDQIYILQIPTHHNCDLISIMYWNCKIRLKKFYRYVNPLYCPALTELEILIWNHDPKFTLYTDKKQKNLKRHFSELSFQVSASVIYHISITGQNSITA